MRVRRAEVVAGLLRILTPTPPDTKTKAPRRRRRRRLNEMSRVRAHVRVNAAKEGGSNGCVVLDQKLLLTQFPSAFSTVTVLGAGFRVLAFRVLGFRGHYRSEHRSGFRVSSG